MEHMGALKNMALGEFPLDQKENAGLRMVNEYTRLEDTEALESIAKRRSGYMKSVKQEAGLRVIQLYFEKRKAGPLRKIAENDEFQVDISDLAWKAAKLCALANVSGKDIEELREKHMDFINNAPMQKRPKSVPPPRLTPADKLKPAKK